MTIEELREALHTAERLCEMLEDTPDLYGPATAVRLELLSRCMDAELTEAGRWAAGQPIDATGWQPRAIYDGRAGRYDSEAPPC